MWHLSELTKENVKVYVKDTQTVIEQNTNGHATVKIGSIQSIHLKTSKKQMIWTFLFLIIFYSNVCLYWAITVFCKQYTKKEENEKCKTYMYLVQIAINVVR